MTPAIFSNSELRLCLIVESGTDVRLVDGLAERFEVTVLARRIVGGVEISHPPAANVPIIIGPASRLSFARAVFEYLRRHRKEIDLVLVQGYGLAALAANTASKFTSADTIMLVCSPVELYYRCRLVAPQPDKPFRRRELLAIQMLARVNALIGSQYVALSNHLAETIREHGGDKAINVIPVYGVDTKLFAPPNEKKSTIKERLGLPTTGSIIFFSSRIAPEKDSETLLAAFRELLKKSHELWLLHRSGGYQSFLSVAQSFGVSDRVIATDAVHPHRQLPYDYQASDLCVQASREEGLGFSPLEALACGLPVVAAATGGLKETIIDGHTGWTYPAGDVKRLAIAIESVLNEPVESHRRASAGRAMVCEKYARDNVFERFEGLIAHTAQPSVARDLAAAS